MNESPPLYGFPSSYNQVFWYTYSLLLYVQMLGGYEGKEEVEKKKNQKSDRPKSRANGHDSMADHCPVNCQLDAVSKTLPIIL
jgi:hypothetical protein